MDYSVVTSIYKDAHLAGNFCRDVAAVFAAHLGIKEDELGKVLEIILVNDGGPGESLMQLLAIQRQYDFVRVADLSRNFGQHEALACGFHLARGKYVLRMNVDMQDRPSEIPKLLRAMMTGQHDLVIGRYKIRNSPLSTRCSAYLYFKLFGFLTGFDAVQLTSPMRVMNRAFLDAYNALTEKSRFPQGLDRWLGFRHAYVEIEHEPRGDYKSSYTLRSRARLAMTGILYFTDRPLVLIASSGLWMGALGFVLALGIVLQKWMGVDLLPGFASLSSIILIGFGLQIGCIGLLGLYVGKIFREVQNRPLYIVKEIYQSNGSTDVNSA